MTDRTGTLYGVGVGPGDPGLVTFRAAEVVKKCEVLAIPAKEKEHAVSYGIMKELLPEIADKICICLATPMTQDRKKLDASYDRAAEKMAGFLAEGKSVAYLTLGDPTVYATYIYVQRRIQKQGYPTEIISGVPAFCSVSAALGESLADHAEQIHIIPSVYGAEEALELSGTKVLMKCGSGLAEIKEMLSEHGKEAELIENCGMKEQHIYRNIQEMPDKAGYYSTLIIRDRDV